MALEGDWNVSGDALHPIHTYITHLEIEVAKARLEVMSKSTALRRVREALLDCCDSLQASDKQARANSLYYGRIALAETEN